MTKIKFAARSETGHVRTNNEDNLYCNGIIMTEADRDKPFFLSGITEAPAVFAVFDGMGGEDCGELASMTAAKSLQEHSSKILRHISEADWEVVSFVKEANAELLDIMRSQGLRMGTTIVMAAAGGESFTVYSLGDSQGFKLLGDRLVRVTEDHTIAAEKVRMGMMTPAQAAKSRENHILTRWLGNPDEWGIAPDVSNAFTFAESRGGLLCSDGLTDMLAFKDIAAAMKANSEPADAVNALVETALEHGGRDNVTCIVFKAEEE